MTFHEVPHFINATNPQGDEVIWNTPEGLDSKDWTFTDWHEPSQQPNDCIVPETCIFIGPFGKVIVKSKDTFV